MVKSISKIKLDNLLNKKSGNDMILVTGVTIGMSVKEAKAMFNKYDSLEFNNFKKNDDGSIDFRLLDADIRIENF